MSNLATRPLTIVTPAMLDAVEAVAGVIVARWSRCGRYVTFQASTRTDPRTESDVCAGVAVIVADAEDVARIRPNGERYTAELIATRGREALARRIAGV